MQALSTLTQLTDLNLKYAKIVPPEPDLAVLAPLANLQNLNLGGCRVLHAPKFRVVRDCDMAALSGLSALRELNLSFCQNITDAGLHELRALRNLKSLNVANCPELTETGLNNVITSLPHLSQVTLLPCILLQECNFACGCAWEHLLYLRATSCSWCLAKVALYSITNLHSVERLPCSFDGLPKHAVQASVKFNISPTRSAVCVFCNGP